MARGKSINVKIKTTKVIKALEQALARLESIYKNQEKNEAAYQKQLIAWRKEVIKYAITKIKEAENIRVNVREYNRTVNIDYDISYDKNSFPTEPAREFESIVHWQYKEQKEEIENAIRILKLTDEEEVSTSTYAAVAKYL